MSSALIRVFISYSVRPPGDEPQFSSQTKAFVDKLYIKLTAEEKIQPFRDSEDIDTGERWFEEIHKSLYSCHACVLVLSKESLSSDYVYSEASVMANRLTRARTSSDSFVVLPVFVGQVGRDELQSSRLQKTGIMDLQVDTIEDPSVSGPADETIDGIVAQLNQLSQHTVTTPRDLIEIQAAQELKSWNISLDAARNILAKIGCDFLGWNEPIDRTGDQIFYHFATDLCDVPVEKAGSVLTELFKGGCLGVASLLDLVAPFWIPEKAARPVSLATFGDPAKRTLTMGEPDGFFVALYICRSLLLSIDTLATYVFEMPPPKTEHLIEELKDELAKCLILENQTNAPRRRSRLSRNRGAGEIHSLLINVLKKREKDGVPIFVVFPAPKEKATELDSGESMPPLIDYKLINDVRNAEGLNTVNLFILHRPSEGAKIEPTGISATVLTPMKKQDREKVDIAYATVNSLLPIDQ